MEINEYLEILPSVDHRAGGGSVAAFNGALACALILKAYNLTERKVNDLRFKLDDNYYKDIEKLKNFFEVAIMGDGKAFEHVLKALKLPKDSDDDRAIRKSELQKSYRIAFESPYNIMIHIVKLFDYIYPLKDFSSENANSELIVAKSQIVASFSSARANVFINLNSINDKEFVERMKNNITKIDQSFVYNVKKFDVLFKKGK